jgi:carboxyl-terminal processing protease
MPLINVLPPGRRALLLLASLLAIANCGGGRRPTTTSSVPAAPGSTGAAADTLSLPERVRLSESMVAHVREHFAHWAPLGAQSFDSMASEFRRDAAASASRWHFDSVALRFTAGLRNGHTRFADRWLWTTRGATLWLQLKPTVDGWVVTSSEITGLRRGDVVRTIDDETIEQFYAARRALIPESGERMRRVSLTFPDYLFPAQFVVGTDDGRRVNVVRGVPTDSSVAARRAGQPLVADRWLVPDSIGYVRVRRFSPRAHEDSALAIIGRRYSTAPALVVDVRGNGGGSTPSRLIAALSGGQELKRLPIERSTIAADRLRFLAGMQSSGTALRYRGALIILADHGCASACDDFVAPFAASDRARVVGDTTWGSTGQPRFLDLGNGMTFQVSARRYTQMDGSPFEGVGIAPHIVVPLRAAELREGRDAALERGIAEARRLLAATTTPAR